MPWFMFELPEKDSSGQFARAFATYVEALVMFFCRYTTLRCEGFTELSEEYKQNIDVLSEGPCWEAGSFVRDLPRDSESPCFFIYA
jgi:hypothetical protein